MKPVAAVRLQTATEAVAVGYVANLVIPRSGEILRAYRVHSTSEASTLSLMATVVLERMLDVVLLLLSGVVAMLLVPERLNDQYPWLTTALAGSCLVLLAVVATILLLWILLRRCETGNDSGVVARPLARIVDWTVKAASQFTTGFDVIAKPSAYAGIFAMSLLLYFGYAGVIYLSFHAMGIESTEGPLGFDAAVVVMFMALIGTVIPTPGATGSYHFFFAETLHVLYGVPLVSALACATVLHALNNLLCIVISVPCLDQYVRSKRLDSRSVRSEHGGRFSGQ